MLAKFLHGAKSKEESADCPFCDIDRSIPAATETDSQRNYALSNVNTGHSLPYGGIPVGREDSVQSLYRDREFLNFLSWGHREIVEYTHACSNCSSQCGVGSIEGVEWHVWCWGSVGVGGSGVNGFSNSGDRWWASE